MNIFNRKKSIRQLRREYYRNIIASLLENNIRFDYRSIDTLWLYWVEYSKANRN